ncbi:acyl-CoA N-acyltransferase [Phycomyces nitens]|nr:acyl-CoA N-acyltransferase [Phycomyces nitens]
MADSLKIRPCALDELKDYFHRWSILEGWNPVKYDAEFSRLPYPMDPQGFLVATIPVNGQERIVSVISGFRHDQGSGFIGYYITDPELRGKGYGYPLFKKALENTKDCKYVGLYAMPAMADKYRAAGFNIVSWDVQRYRSGPLDEFLKQLSKATDEQQFMVDISEAPIDQLVSLDEKYNGVPRSVYITKWIKSHVDGAKEGLFGVAIVKNEKVLAYGCARPTEESFRVGPLYASTAEQAKTVLKGLASKALEVFPTLGSLDFKPASCLLDLDTCTDNKAAMDMIQSFDWKPYFRVIRMWKGNQPPENTEGLYGVTSLEIG